MGSWLRCKKHAPRSEGCGAVCPHVSPPTNPREGGAHWSKTMPSTTNAVHPAATAMRAIVDSVVQDFRTDFQYDLEHIEAHPNTPFVWYARRGGTHMYSRANVRHGVASGWSGFSKCPATIAAQDGDNWYHWDGYTLRAVSTDRATALVREWERAAPPETEDHKERRYKAGGWLDADK